MHELSIAQEILDIVKNQLPPETKKLKTIRMKVGKLSGILVESLKFCFEAIVTETEFSSVTLDIQEVPIKIKCNECEAESNLSDPIFICPECESFNVRILSGKELEITEIEIED